MCMTEGSKRYCESLDTAKARLGLVYIGRKSIEPTISQLSLQLAGSLLSVHL